MAGLVLALSEPSVAMFVDGHLLGDAASALACAVVAAVVLARLPGQPVGLTFAAIAVCKALSVLATASVGVGPSQASVALWLDNWLWVPGLVLTVAVLPLVFPHGPTSGVQLGLLRADLVVLLVLIVAVATGPTLSVSPGSGLPNPLAVPGSAAVGGIAAVVGLGLAAASVVVLLRRLALAGPGLRRQLAPFIVAGMLALAAVVLANGFGRAGVIVQDLVVLGVPAAALVCVLRYRLYDLEVVVRRTALYVGLSVTLVIAYVVVVQAVTVSARLEGRPASIVATAAVALAFGPVKATFSRALSRWLYGEADEPYAALARTTQLLGDSADPLTALRRATSSLAHALRCPAVRIRRADGLLVGREQDGTAALVVSLEQDSGVRLGEVEVVARSPGERFSSADEQLVSDLAAPLAGALAAVVAAEDLDRARAGLVRGREEERRRLRGELHDDIGPTLAAIAVQTATATRRLERGDPAGAGEVLDRIQETVQHAVTGLRGVVDALRPDSVDEVGLAAAVSVLAASLSDDDLAIAVHVAPLPDLPAATEVAVYRVVAEALTNVRRHARASHTTVSMRTTAAGLTTEVVDNGAGPGAGVRPGGVGLGSMQARLAELGGQLTLAPVHPHGTRLTAHLPAAALAPPPQAPPVPL